MTRETGIWRVCGALLCDYESEQDILFEAYFTTKEAAQEALQKGEREHGKAAGYKDMRWSLEGFCVNVNLEPMFEDVKENLEMLFPSEK